jgi:hypothetical protein
LDLT